MDPAIASGILTFYSGVLQSVLAGEVTRKLTELNEHHESQHRAETAALQQSLQGSEPIDRRVERACAQAMKTLRLDETESVVFWPLVQDQLFTESLPGHLAGNALSVEPGWLRNFPGATDATTEALDSLARKLTQTALQAVASDELLTRILDLRQSAEVHRMVQRIEPQTALLPGMDEKLNRLLGLQEQSTTINVAGTALDSLREKIAEAFGLASTALLSWPVTLDDAERTRLEPKQAEAARAGFATPSGSTTLLLGGPGSGKSALLASIGSSLVEGGQTVLALKADTLPQSINSPAALDHHLDLPQGLLGCIKLMSEVAAVFVLIDQLDALADLVDLQPGRLNTLLHLVRRLSDIPNVHVLASCREFEYRHDVRLTAIDATLVHLELPSWEEVAAVLAKHDVPQAADWPLGLRDLLRSPQHLKVFLNVLRGGTEPELFTSYQMMMDRLWELRVTNANGLTGRSEFLNSLATRMANDEMLWVPLVQYEHQAALVTQLEAGGILMRSPDVRSIGFSHQTLFNFARARAFVRNQQGQGLAEYVLARQHALFVRPTLWSSLIYLRGADRQAFQREFGTLWSEPTLRVHIRLLLIEFLGQLEDPDDQEAGWLLPCLADEVQRGHALRAMAGRNGWFERLSGAYLPMLMGRDNPQDLSDVTRFLSEAWRTSYEGVLDLILKYWSGHPSKDVFSWSAMESLRQWDARTVKLVCTLLGRGQVHPARVMDVISAISLTAPTLAPQAVAVALQTKLDQVLAELLPPPPLPDHATEEERNLWEWTHSPAQTLRRLFEEGTGLYSLIEVAEASPSEFLQAIWPWFLQVLRLSASPLNEVMHNYRHDVGFAVVGESPVLDSIEAAIIKLAEHKPDEFRSLVKQWAGEDLYSVQQLLMTGMGKLFSTEPQAALDFLLADARRFEVGSAFDTDGETTAFIAGLTPHLSEPQRRQLEVAIQAWEPHRKNSVSQKPLEDRRRFARWAREAHLRLLLAMGSEHLSADVRDFVLHENRALPQALERGVTMRGGTVASPMSAEQMTNASDEHILSLFAELTDGTGWHHPRRPDFLIGGSIQASAVFGELAKKFPDKVLSIINRLSPGIQEIPVANAIKGLAESALPPEDLVHLIAALDRRGFNGETFRVYAAWALDKVIGNGYRLPDEVCALLESWREQMQNAGQSEETAPRPRLEVLASKSILWGQSGTESLPQGTFTILETLSRALLSRTPMEVHRWLDLLERHLAGPENERTWKLLCRLFPDLRHANHARAIEFLRTLFTRYPGVRDSAAGTLLLALGREWMEPEFVRASMQSIRSSTWANGPQAYAELLPLLAVQSTHQWVVGEIDMILATASVEASVEISSVQVGLAYAAVNLWGSPQYREITTRILIRLLNSPIPEVRRVIMRVFGIVKFLPPDEFTTTLLEGLLAHPAVLEMSEATYFVDRLSDVLPSCPELVVQLAEALVAQVAATPANLQTGSQLPMAELVNLSMTFQRLSLPLRVRGLELFERLLALSAYEVRGTLAELDNRPTTRFMQMPRRPRRRPRRRNT